VCVYITIKNNNNLTKISDLHALKLKNKNKK
jgi:hypothetical protein